MQRVGRIVALTIAEMKAATIVVRNGAALIVTTAAWRQRQVMSRELFQADLKVRLYVFPLGLQSRVARNSGGTARRPAQHRARCQFDG
jgi:hypothetical protein